MSVTAGEWRHDGVRTTAETDRPFSAQNEESPEIDEDRTKEIKALRRLPYDVENMLLNDVHFVELGVKKLRDWSRKHFSALRRAGDALNLTDHKDVIGAVRQAIANETRRQRAIHNFQNNVPGYLHAGQPMPREAAAPRDTLPAAVNGLYVCVNGSTLLLGNPVFSGIPKASDVRSAFGGVGNASEYVAEVTIAVNALAESNEAFEQVRNSGEITSGGVAVLGASTIATARAMSYYADMMQQWSDAKLSLLHADQLPPNTRVEADQRFFVAVSRLLSFLSTVELGMSFPSGTTSVEVFNSIHPTADSYLREIKRTYTVTESPVKASLMCSQALRYAIVTVLLCYCFDRYKELGGGHFSRVGAGPVLGTQLPNATLADVLDGFGKTAPVYGDVVPNRNAQATLSVGALFTGLSSTLYISGAYAAAPQAIGAVVVGGLWIGPALVVASFGYAAQTMRIIEQSPAMLSEIEYQYDLIQSTANDVIQFHQVCQHVVATGSAAAIGDFNAIFDAPDTAILNREPSGSSSALRVKPVFDEMSDADTIDYCQTALNSVALLALAYMAPAKYASISNTVSSMHTSQLLTIVGQELGPNWLNDYHNSDGFKVTVVTTYSPTTNYSRFFSDEPVTDMANYNSMLYGYSAMMFAALVAAPWGVWGVRTAQTVSTTVAAHAALADKSDPKQVDPAEWAGQIGYTTVEKGVSTVGGAVTGGYSLKEILIAAGAGYALMLAIQLAK